MLARMARRESLTSDRKLIGDCLEKCAVLVDKRVVVVVPRNKWRPTVPAHKNVVTRVLTPAWPARNWRA